MRPTSAATVRHGSTHLLALSLAGIGLLWPTAGKAQTAPPTITSALNVTATVGQVFTYQVAGTNAPYKYGAACYSNGSWGYMPGDFSGVASTGVVTGTPTVAGTYTWCLSATNSAGTGRATLNVTVLPAPAPPVITSPLTATATVGKLFSYQVTATNAPYKFGAACFSNGSWGYMPGEFSGVASTGVVTGTPTAPGTYKWCLSATNVAGTARATLDITVVADLASVTLSWTAPPEPTVVDYRIYYGTSSGSYLQGFGNGISAGYRTSHSISGLTRGKTYYFAVTAVDAIGNESTYSNEASKAVQ